MSNNNEFEKTNKLNNLQQLSTDFDFYKDFELKEMLESKELESNNSINYLESEKNDELNNMINSLPLINDNIRENINLSIEIYKKLNNFDHKYIHKIINEKLSNK